MNILPFIWLLAIACVRAQQQPDIPDKKPAAKALAPKTAHLQKQGGGVATVDGHNARGQDYFLTGKKEDATAKALGGSKVWESKNSKTGLTATNPRGNHGTIKRTSQTDGSYETDRNKGKEITSKQGNDRVGHVENNQGRQKMDSKIIGGAKGPGGFQEMDTQGTRGNVWKTDPDAQPTKGGNKGHLERVNAKKKYSYEVTNSQDGNSETAKLEDPSSQSLFRKAKNYKCEGSKVGVSTCKDDLGRKVGEARTAVNGDTVVTNSLGIPVATVRAKQKDPKTGVPTATVDGMFTAKSTSQQDMNCPGFTNDKVKLKPPLKFREANKRDPKGVEFAWPACVDMVGTFVLAPGIEARNLAIRFTVLVLPAGRMNCNDPATQACGGEPTDCYYCDLCEAEKRGKVIILDNARSSICDIKGPATIAVTYTMCPPPEVTQFNYCDEFQKPIGDPYWKKKGNLDATSEVFDRPSDQETDAIYNDPVKSAGAFTDFKKDPKNIQYILSWKPPQPVFKQWYKINKAVKVGCRENIVNYDVTGSKVNTGFLLDASAAAGVFQKPKCPHAPGKK